MPQDPKSLKTQLLECHSLMNSKRKDDIEQAISIMMEILKKEPDYIPAIYVSNAEFIYLIKLGNIGWIYAT